jgi:putative transposase
MTYWRLYYHLVWSTRNRLPAIDDGAEVILRQVLVAEARQQSCLVHGIGCMPDHVHLAISIPPRVAVAEVVRTLKGSSSRTLKGHADHAQWPGWQSEYGVISFGERSLDDVLRYLRDQKAHHAAQTTRTSFEIDNRRQAGPPVVDSPARG